MAELVQVRDEGRREGRGEGRGERRGDQGERGGGERGGYRGQPYASPPPRGYAYPAPGPAYPYPQAAPPPAYAQPRTYGYATPPAARYAPNSLGSGWRPQQEDTRRGVREGAMVPLGQVIANIQRTTRGRILDAGTEPGPDGRPTYRVRWAAAGGRRIDFMVDAATGAIIGQSGY